MYLRRINVKKDGKNHYYWALAESYRTAKGSRQRIVCYLGDVDKRTARGLQQAAERCDSYQQDFLSPEELPHYVEIDTHRVRTERHREFGAVWLGLKLYELVGLEQYFCEAFERGKEKIDWPTVIKILVISRFYAPCSELHIADHVYEKSAFEDLVGVPSSAIHENRLYRCLDRLLPHKDRLQQYLKDRLGTLFELQYDLMLYDVTSTYFEGAYEESVLAQRGYSRDKRSDCKQVCIALVVTREGVPIGYEIFAGNTHDRNTVKHIVTYIESLYGQADRIWVWDRGMSSAAVVDFLIEGKRRYIIGTPKSLLKKVEQHLVGKQWKEVVAGVEVKNCQSPFHTQERFILCRSQDRASKEKAIHDRFVVRIEKGIEKIKAACEKARGKDIHSKIERRVGRLLQSNSRAAKLFEIKVGYDDRQQKTTVTVTKKDSSDNWIRLTEGYYMLRTNITDWEATELWKAYIQLTEAEEAFRIHKSDLHIRPIWHRKDDRIKAHIFVCFLSYVLWKALAVKCKKAGLGDEPRRVFEEVKKIGMTDVVLKTKDGNELKIRTVIKPDKPLQILLNRLGLVVPKRLSKRIL